MDGTDTAELRPVLPLQAGDLDPVDPGPRPDLVWLPLAALRINEAYQRSLSERGVRLIRRMVREFAWSRLKALSVADIGGGLYEVIDGQHTAIAAATHGGIDALPCLVVHTRDVSARAADFVGLNRNRLTMTPLQVFAAELAAGDEDARDADRGARLGGGRILRAPPPYGRYRPGDIIAVARIKAVAASGGVAWVRRVTQIGVQARCAPLKAQTIGALVRLLWGPEAGQVPDEAIVDAIRLCGQDALIARASARKRTGDSRSVPALVAAEILAEVGHG